MKGLSVIIVNWNTGSLLKRCLESLSALPEKDLITQVVVVDNASTDDSVEQAKVDTYGIPVEWKQLKTNAGFAKANNVGIDWTLHAHGMDQHILLLNPDTEVQPAALLTMLNVLDRHGDVGIVGPKLFEPGGKFQASVHSFPTLGTLITVYLKLHSLFPNSMKGQAGISTETVVDEVKGAAYLIRDETMDAVGPLDERYWIWFEEVDYCKRAQQAGWKTMYTPNAAVLHYGGVSFNQLVGLRRSLPFLVSGYRYANKHLGIIAGAVLTLLFPVAVLLSLPASLKHRMVQKKNKKVLIS
ncbi:MAG: glycosyltransferase family 2 protein [Candidatus Andersenbacteria bacterium]